MSQAGLLTAAGGAADGGVSDGGVSDGGSRSLATFDTQVADYVQLTDDVLPDTDTYWTVPTSGWDENDPASLAGHNATCNSVFGETLDPTTPSLQRDFPIIEAHDDRLLIGRFGYTSGVPAPRAPGSTSWTVVGRDPGNAPFLKLMQCCFAQPGPFSTSGPAASGARTAPRPVSCTTSWRPGRTRAARLRASLATRSSTVAPRPSLAPSQTPRRRRSLARRPLSRPSRAIACSRCGIQCSRSSSGTEKIRRTHARTNLRPVTWRGPSRRAGSSRPSSSISRPRRPA